MLLEEIIKWLTGGLIVVAAGMNPADTVFVLETGSGAVEQHLTEHIEQNYLYFYPEVECEEMGIRLYDGETATLQCSLKNLLNPRAQTISLPVEMLFTVNPDGSSTFGLVGELNIDNLLFDYLN